MDNCIPRLFAAAVVMSGLCFCAPTAATAQGGPPQHIRGTITAAEAAVLTVKTREGAVVKLALPEKIRVSGYVITSYSIHYTKLYESNRCPSHSAKPSAHGPP